MDDDPLDTNLYRRTARKKGEGWDDYGGGGGYNSDGRGEADYEADDRRQRSSFIQRELARRRKTTDSSMDGPKVSLHCQ